MDCLIISAFVFLVTLPSIVTGLEWKHNWSKLYNFGANLINKIFKTKISLIQYKSEPNTLEHQVKTFKEWFIIGAGLFGVELVIKAILLFI